MKSRKFLLFQLLLLSLMCLGCEQKNTANFKTLRLNLSDDPVSWDPRVVRSLKDLTVVKQLFEGLTRISPEGKPEPAIASSIHVSEDLLTYTFFLKDACWSNGDPVKAEDFVSSWQAVCTPAFASDYSYMLYPIKNAKKAREGTIEVCEIGASAIDSKTLVVTLEAPTPYFLELTAFPTYFPVHPLGLFDSEKKLICNGPFMLASWKPCQEIFFRKNNAYWDKENVKLEGLSFSVLSDATTEAHLFEKHALDWLGQPVSGSLASEVLNRMKEENKISSYPIAGTRWFTFNTKKSPFHLSKLRKSLTVAINRGEIISYILQGNQEAATGPLPSSMALKTSPYFKDGDSETALSLFEEILSENGWTRETFPKIVVNYPSSERNSKVMQLVQQQWKTALGLDIELTAMEYQLFRRNLRLGDFQIALGEWIADFNDPLAFLELFKYLNDDKLGNGMNDTGWANEEFAELLNQALTEKDPGRRSSLLFTAEKILMDEMPICPLYHYAFDYVKNPNVEGVVLSPLGSADFKWADIR